MQLLDAITGPMEPRPMPEPKPEGHSPSDPLAFIFGGNAIFTLVSVASGKRFTYRVKLADANPAYPRAGKAWFVQMLTGPDNTDDYTYVGLISEREPTVIRVTKASRPATETARKGLEWALRGWARDHDLSAHLQMFHAGRCGRCARLLTVPSSIESGFGPECAGKLD